MNFVSEDRQRKIKKKQINVSEIVPNTLRQTHLWAQVICTELIEAVMIELRIQTHLRNFINISITKK